MDHRPHASQTRYSSSEPHSNEVEHRLTKSETTIEAHSVRISFLEKAVHGIIASLGALATSKAGELAELASTLFGKVK